VTRWAAVGAIALLLGSCTGARVTTGPLEPAPAAVPSRSPAPPASTSTRAEPITLVADLSSPAARWERVATIPFGKGPERLGRFDDRRLVSLPLIPPSFAVGTDSSLWILDEVKERVAHYDGQGRYVGRVSLERQPWGNFRDVALTGGGLAVLQEIHPLTGQGPEIDSRIDFLFLGPDGEGQGITPCTGGSGIYVSLLFARPDSQADTSVIGDVRAYSDFAGTPMGRFARFYASGNGEAAFGRGLPLGDDLWAGLESTSDQDFEVTFLTGTGAATQPVHVRVVPTLDAGGMRAVVGSGMEVALSSGVGILVQLQPSAERDADRYGGGRWYLQLGPDNEPLVWEPIPYGSHQQERQVRHLARGPGDSVYLMELTPSGEVIYRRP
jgi:hypothetical protein